MELRKQKREDEMMKRRNVDLSGQFESEDSSNEQKVECLPKGESLFEPEWNLPLAVSHDYGHRENRTKVRYLCE